MFHSPSGGLNPSGLVTILLMLAGAYQELHSFKIFVDRSEFWGYAWTPLIFGVAACALIAVDLWLVRGVRSSIGLAVIMLGLPFFYHWRTRAVA